MLAEKLRDRGTPAFSLAVPERKALRPLSLRHLGQPYGFLRPQRRRDPDGAYCPATVQDLAKDLELGRSKDSGDVLDFEAIAEIRLVDAIALHRLRVRDAAHRRCHRNAEHLLPDVRKAALDHVDHVVLSHE